MATIENKNDFFFVIDIKAQEILGMSGSWSPKLPPGNQDSFMDWMGADNEQARTISAKCECGVDATYKNTEEAAYWHSYWCPKYKEKPKKEDKSE